MAYNLKSADEVKEYLENLLTEYQFGCYSEKKAEDYMDAIQRKSTDAANIYKTTCDKYDYGKSCGRYGGFRAAGQHVDKDPKDGYKYLKKGCELNDPKSCFLAGSLQFSADDTGVDKPTRVKEGLQFLTKACDQYRVEQACAYVAGLYLGSAKDEVPKDITEAFHYSLKACDLGNPYACANVSQMHKRGEGTEKNLMLADTFQKRAELLYAELVKTQKQLKFHQGL